MPPLNLKSLKPLLSLAAAHSKAVTILALVFVASSGYAAWLHEHDVRVAERATMQQALAHSDSAIHRAELVQARAETLTVHDSVRVVHTTRALDTLWQTVPDTIRTRADTVRVLTELPQIKQASRAATNACTDDANDCAAFRVAANATEDSLRARIKLVAQQVHDEKPSRFSWGVTGGIAAVRDGTGWHTGPGLTLGLTLRF